MGYLRSLFKLEDKIFNGIISYLEKEINYVKPKYMGYESEYFNSDYKNSEMNKITQRVRRFTEFIQEPLCEKNNKHEKKKIISALL